MKPKADDYYVTCHGVVGIFLRRFNHSTLLYQPENGIGGSFVVVPKDPKTPPYVGNILDALDEVRRLAKEPRGEK